MITQGLNRGKGPQEGPVSQPQKAHLSKTLPSQWPNFGTRYLVKHNSSKQTANTKSTQPIILCRMHKPMVDCGGFEMQFCSTEVHEHATMVKNFGTQFQRKNCPQPIVAIQYFATWLVGKCPLAAGRQVFNSGCCSQTRRQQSPPQTPDLFLPRNGLLNYGYLRLLGTLSHPCSVLLLPTPHLLHVSCPSLTSPQMPKPSS
jgi:hypothetical protein